MLLLRFNCCDLVIELETISAHSMYFNCYDLVKELTTDVKCITTLQWNISVANILLLFLQPCQWGYNRIKVFCNKTILLCVCC